MSRDREQVPLRGRPSEVGFSMIEVVVALGLIALSMASVATVFYGSLSTAGISSFRSAAVSVATRETEAIHAVPYRDVGFYSGQTGYVSTFESEPTVTLNTGNPPGARVQPTGTLTVGPITYTIRRHITWADTSAGGTTLAEAYKKTTVLVTWRDQGQNHEARQDSIFYPGGQSNYVGLGSATTIAPPATPPPPATPTNLTASAPPAPQDQTQINLTWSPPTTGGAPTAYIIERATNNSFNNGFVSIETPATSTAFAASGLAPSTTYYFRVIARNDYGESTPSNVVSRTTAAAPACSVSGLQITGSVDGFNTKTYLHPTTGAMRENLLLAVSISNCSGTYRVAGAFNNAADPGSPYSLNNSGNGTILSSGTTGWAIGIHQFKVIDAAGADVSPAVTKSFLVCDGSIPLERRSNANKCDKQGAF